MNQPNLQGMPGMNGFQPTQQQGAGQITPANLRSFLQSGFARTQATPGSWQAHQGANARAGIVCELVSAIRLAQPNSPFSQAVKKAMAVEAQLWNSCPSQEAYTNQIRQYLLNIKQARSQIGQNTLGGMNAMNGQQSMMQPPSQQPNPGMPQQQQNQPSQFLQNLSQPMVATPIPQNAQNPASTGTEQQGMAAANMQPQRSQQPGMATPQPNGQQRPFTQQEQQFVINYVQKHMSECSPEMKERLNMEFQQLPPEQKAQHGNNIQQFISNRYKREAFHALSRLKMQRAQHLQHNGGFNTPQQNMAQFGQPQRTPQMGSAMHNNIPDLSHLAEQQANAMRSQDTGQLVVPASNNTALNQPMTNLMGLGGQMPGNMQMPNGAGQNPLALQQQQQRLQQQQNFQAQLLARQNMLRQQQQQQQQQHQGSMPGQMPQASPANMPLLTQPVVQQPNGNAQPNGGQFGQTPGQNDQQAFQALQQAQNAQQKAQLEVARQRVAQKVGPEAVRMLPDTFIVALARASEQDFPALYQKARHLIEQRMQTHPIMQQGNNGQSGIQNVGQQMPQNRPNVPNGVPQQISNQNMAMIQAQRMLQQQQQQQQPNAQQQGPGMQQALPMPSRELIAKLDQQPFPGSIQLANRFPTSIPPNVKTWGQLKHWVASNPGMGGPDATAITKMQWMLYGRTVQRQQQMQQMAGQVPTPGAQNQPGGPAPQAPMVPNGMTVQPMQQPGQIPNMPPDFQGLPQPTPQEMAQFRRTAGADLSNLSDDQVRHRIMLYRLKQRSVESQHARLQHQVGQQPNRVQQAPQPQRPQQLPQQPAAMPMSQTPRIPQSQPKVPQQTSQQRPQQGIKRPSPDDVVEIPNPAQQGLPSAPLMQVQRSQQANKPNIPPEQWAKLTAAQRAALMGQQRTNNQPQTDPVSQKIQELNNRVETNLPRGQPVPMPPQQRQKLQEVLQSQWKSFTVLPRFVHLYAKEIKWDEAVITQILQARFTLLKEIRDPRTQTPVLNDQLTNSFDVLMKCIMMVVKFAVTTANELQMRKNGSQGQPQQAPQAQLPATQQPTAQKQAIQGPPSGSTKPQQPGHRRNTSKAPAAPTEAKPPFPFAPHSPHGTPLYANGTQNMDLKLPDKKKQKVKQSGSAAGTPGIPTPAPSNSPQSTKTGDAKKMQQAAVAKPPVPPKPVFYCSEQGCEHRTQGFDSQQQLETHAKEAHKPITDPLQFCLGAMKDTLGLDGNGQPKKQASPARPASGNKQVPQRSSQTTKGTPTTATQMGKTGSAQGPITRASPAASAQAKTVSAAQPGTDAKIEDAKAEDDWDPSVFSTVFSDLDDSSAFSLLSDFGVEGAESSATTSAFDINDLFHNVGGSDLKSSNSPPLLSSSPSTGGATPSSNSSGPAGANKEKNKSPQQKNKTIPEETDLAMNLQINGEHEAEFEDLMADWTTMPLGSPSWTILDNEGNAMDDLPMQDGLAGMKGTGDALGGDDIDWDMLMTDGSTIPGWE